MKRLHIITVTMVVICDMLLQEISCSANLASRKSTKISSKKKPWENPKSSVDGNVASCARTNGTLSGWHWWQVDLVGTYSVRYVNITNRAKCCEGSLQGFSIEVSEKDPSTLPGFPGTTNASVCMTRKDPIPTPGTFTYVCNQPVTGRFVRIVQGTMNFPLPILLCEFEVYGDPIGPPNLALGKPATQSSLNNFHKPLGFAKKAVDGIINGDYGTGNSCTHTALFGYWHWWQVDLQGTYNISAVRVTNRYDCCSERLRDFSIEVSEEEPSHLPGFPQPTNAAVCLTRKDAILTSGPVMLECHQPIKGRYIRIVKKGPSALSLCEVEVFESTIKPTKAPDGKGALWRFIYIASQGSIDVFTLSELTRLMIDCARKRISLDDTNIYATPYIHIDFHTGTCRFFEYAPHRSAQPSSNWIMYKLE